MPFDPSLCVRQRWNVKWVIFHEIVESFTLICGYKIGHVLLVDIVEPGPDVAHFLDDQI